MRDAVLVGAGPMGEAWIDTVSRRDDVRLAAVVDLRPDAARDALGRRGMELPVFASLDDALAAGSADIVLNVTIPAAHLAVSSTALRAGVPVLSEKPLTETLAEGLELTALSELTGTLVATSQSRRFSRGIIAFRDALRPYGGAAQLSARFFQNPRFGGFRDEMDSPLLRDMAIHTFDQARFLLDDEPTRVYCEEFSPPWSWYRGAAAADAVFGFAGGARFSYSGSWCADGLMTSWNGDWHASAAGGSATWDGETTVRVQASDEPRTAELPDAAEGLDGALDEFLTALDGGAPPSGEVHANIWSLAMVEGAVASSATGRPVEFAELFADAHARAVAAAPSEVAAVLRAWSEPAPRRA